MCLWCCDAVLEVKDFDGCVSRGFSDSIMFKTFMGSVEVCVFVSVEVCSECAVA